jgi:hypothetical protein
MAPSGTSRPSQYNEVLSKLPDEDTVRGAGFADIMLAATGAKMVGTRVDGILAIGLAVIEFGQGRVVETSLDDAGSIVATLRLATGVAVATGANSTGRFVAGVVPIVSVGAAVPDMETGGSVEVWTTGEATGAERVGNGVNGDVGCGVVFGAEGTKFCGAATGALSPPPDPLHNGCPWSMHVAQKLTKSPLQLTLPVGHP